MSSQAATHMLRIFCLDKRITGMLGDVMLMTHRNGLQLGVLQLLME